MVNQFHFTEKGATNNRNDAMADAAYWVEDNPGTENDHRWVFTCGYVTENDAGGNPHKRLAVYKYDADKVLPVSDPPPPGYDAYEERYLYPPDPGGQAWTPTGDHQATDLIVDREGNVYVCGMSTIEQNGDSGTDNNYVVLKFDKGLVLDDDWATNANGWGGVPGVWGYDGPFHGADGAMKMALDEGPTGEIGDEYLFVTGSSQSAEHGMDILTIKFNAVGTLDTTWGNHNGEGDGIVRWDGAEHGDDTAADITVGPMPDSEDNFFPLAVVVGTSDQGEDHLGDVAVLGHGIVGDVPVTTGNSGLGWTRFVNKDRQGADTNDRGVAICGQDGATSRVFVCGTSVMGDQETSPDTDYVVAAFNWGTGASWWPSPVWQDVDSKGDDARDIEWIELGGAVPQESLTALAVTGQVTDGTDTRCGTFLYNADVDGDLLDSSLYSYLGSGAWGQKVLIANGVWVVGGVLSAVADTDVLLMRFPISGQTLGTPVVGRFPGDGSALFDQGISGALGDESAEEVFVVGQTTYSATYGPDGAILGVSEP
jgi:hypothetical protein